MISSVATRGSRVVLRCAALLCVPLVWTVGCGSPAPTRGQAGQSGTNGSAGVAGGGTGGQSGGSTGGTASGGHAGSSGGGGSAGSAGSSDAGSAQGGGAGQVTAPDAGAVCSSEPAPSCAQNGCPVPPSCASGGSGRTDCGANKESCCTTLEVPCGAYYRTYSNDGTGPMGQDDPAVVSNFRLDKYLVTVGRFRQFVQAWNGGSGYTPPSGSGKHTHLNGGKGLVNAAGSVDAGAPSYEPGWVTSNNSNLMLTNQNLACDPTYATWTKTAGSNEDFPINCVNWYEAYAFCIWDGGFLPSEAEFEYASAGGSQQREYPWGEDDPGTSSAYAIFGCDHGADGGGCTGLVNLAPVGTTKMGAGRWGHLDLAGETSEWNLDVYASFGDPCIDCAAFQGGSGRVNRGGSFRSSASPYLQSFFRGDLLYATDRTSSFGIRCARTP